MSWRIKSFQSVGPLEFGQSRNETRTILGSGFQPFNKAGSGNQTDAYPSLGLHIYFDDEDRVEFIEAFSPADIDFNGISLLGKKAAEATNQLRALGYEGEQDDVGYQYESIGIGLTISGDQIEGVGIFRKGYYD